MENNEFKAEDARNLVKVFESMSSDKVDEQVKEVLNLIKDSAITGYDGCRYYVALYAKTKRILIERGFKVVDIPTASSSTSYNIITWNE